MGELQPEGLERMLRPVVILRKVVGVDKGGVFMSFQIIDGKWSEWKAEGFFLHGEVIN